MFGFYNGALVPPATEVESIRIVLATQFSCLSPITGVSIMLSLATLPWLLREGVYGAYQDGLLKTPTHHPRQSLFRYQTCTYLSNIDRGIRNTSRQISFQFLFIKTRPPDKLHNGFTVFFIFLFGPSCASVLFKIRSQ